MNVRSFIQKYLLCIYCVPGPRRLHQRTERTKPPCSYGALIPAVFYVLICEYPISLGPIERVLDTVWELRF